jgi:asparagine synthase (glutamine-hydrolysing)
MVSTKEAQELVSSIPSTYDEPYADASAIPTMLVSRLAKQQVTMTLSGDGGDELFLGYGMYKWAKRFDSNLFKYYQKPAKFLFSKMKPKYKRISLLLDSEDKSELKSHIFSQEQYFFSKKEIKSLVANRSNENYHLEESFKLRRELNAMEDQAFFDLKYYFPDDLLVKVDRASMKYSLETRVPLLDYRIIEFALNLPEKFKFQKNTSKYILKDILYDYIPKSYFDRPKWGFGIPLNNWLRSDLSYLIKEYLNATIIRKYNVVKYEEVDSLLSRWNKGDDFLYNRIWLLIILHMWLNENINA